MDDTLSDAIREAYAAPRSSDIVYDTLEITHPLVAEPFYIVADRKPLTATLEDASVVTFQPVGFRFTRPSSDASGLQELRITIDNVDRQASDFILATVASNIPPQVKYRPYHANDLGAPGIDPPLLLFLREARITQFQVTARATFADLLNKPFLHVLYRRRTFPALGN